MASFKTRINQQARDKGKIILANDYDSNVENLESKTIKNIKTLKLKTLNLKKKILNHHN